MLHLESTALQPSVIVKCSNCGHILGEFLIAKGQIKCRRGGCKKMNQISVGDHKLNPDEWNVGLLDRMTKKE